MHLSRPFRASSNAIALLIGIALSHAAAADPPRWQMLPTHSRLQFEVDVMGNPFEGRFTAYTADVAFDPADPGAGHIDVRVDLRATSTGMSEADSALPTATWFDIERHPEARFKADNFVATDTGFEGDAVLTLKERPLTLRFPFAWSVAQGQARLTSQIVVERLHFAIGTDEFESDDTVGFEVTVHVDVTLEAAD